MIGQIAVYYGLYCLQLVAAFAVTDVTDASGFGFLEMFWWSALFAISLRCGRQQGLHPRKNFEQAGNGTALFGLLMFFVMLTTSGLVPALLNLTLWAQAAQNFTLVKRRSHYFAFVITFALILFAAATSKSGFFLFTLTAYVLAAIFTLYVHYLDQRNEVMTHHDEALGKLPLMGPVLGLSVLIVSLAIAAYLIIPRPPALHYGAIAASGGHEYSNQDWEDKVDEGKDATGPDTGEENSPEKSDSENGPESTQRRSDRSNGQEGAGNGGESAFDYSGFKEQFDIHAPGKSRLSNAIMLYLHADRPLYLKGQVFDTFDGKVWSQADTHNKKQRLDQGVYAVAASDDGVGEPVFQEITVAHDLTDVLFVAERLHRITFPARVLAQDIYGGLRAPARLRKDTVYSAESRIAYIEQRPASGPVAAGDMSTYLQLPADMTTRVGELAAQASQAADSSMAKALALENHLRSQYRYTFNTLLDDDASITVERFLFETREGHCEFFATAMVLMLRTLDIPARLVTGFSATNLNPMTGYYEVRGLDAHAWVEGYFPEQGWVLFEPTAFYDLPAPDSSKDVSESIASYAERVADLAQAIDPDALSTSWLMLWSAVLNGIGALWHQVVNGLTSLLTSLRAWLMGGGLFVVAPMLLLAFGYYVGRHALRARWALWQMRRKINHDPAMLVRRAYVAMEAYFAGKGLARAPAWTVAEYRQRLQERFPGKAASVAIIAAYYTQSRYGLDVLKEDVATEVVESFDRLLRR